MPNANYVALIPLLPLLAFVILGLSGKKIFSRSAGIVATLFILGSAILALYTAYGYFFEWGKVEGAYQKLIILQFTWLEFSPGLAIDMGILLDPIAAMMLAVVTFISLMVHIYSISYLKGESRYSTFFAFLCLFTFSMLGLVLSSNLFQIYIFWELVGVSSFLLIGFYYDKSSALAAAKKAFIVTRFADLGFLIGILILSFYAGTLDFSTLIQRFTTPGAESLEAARAGGFLGISALTWGLTLVFMGGAGKSAMFPLHIWLPDAMEGPTPVSALIHAATMVVAGVFLVARLFPVLAISATEVLGMIAFVGVFSAFIAALIACTQTDIKRVLAYSTMSQIGFMIFALGVSGYGGEAGLGFTASQFHLFTHALFKALLFLGAGVVIHHVHSNELKDMGGLRKVLPVTHITFLIACLAIAGLPPFSGFFSKEEILLAAWERNKPVFWVALVTSGLTAFYMFRLYFSIFWNRPYGGHVHHEKEGDFNLLFPLVVLAIGSALAGFIPFGRFVTSDSLPLETSLHILFSIAPVLLALTGIALAWKGYKTNNEGPARMAGSLGSFYAAARHKFYIDELYLFVTQKILFNLVGRPAAWFDRNIVDGLVNLTGFTTERISAGIKGFQSGKVQQYAMVFLAALILLAAAMVIYMQR
jgi:NADH-quinone oxidoreductase subunit L